MITRVLFSRKSVIYISLFLCLGVLITAVLGSMTDISAIGSLAAGESKVPVRTLLGSEIFVYSSPMYGEKIRISLDEAADALVAATIATEDRTFFRNPGFSPSAIVRAFFQNLRMMTTYSGASTITQQVVRNILIPPEERYERTIFRKAKEIILSVRLTMKYDKETILSVYLNEIYYGQNATGVEKAAEIYFGKHAADLDLGEAAFIAGLPQAPNYYGLDPQAGIHRQHEVLQVMQRIIREERCIPVRSGKNFPEYCPSEEALFNARLSPEDPVQ